MMAIRTPSQLVGKKSESMVMIKLSNSSTMKNSIVSSWFFVLVQQGMAIPVLLLLLMGIVADACTIMMVTPGATTDGSTMSVYNADAPDLMGMVYHYPATNRIQHQQQPNATKSTQPVYSWDQGIYLGEIHQVDITYNVVGNSNEHGLVIGESTFDGVEILRSQSGAVMDYGSLMYVLLQRCKTALEAVHMMVDLMDTYGYASTGESFSIVDRSGDVWIMEVIGRGDSYGKMGSVYVAYRIPDGTVTAAANQARIRTFPRDDHDNCIFAKDVVDVAVHYGLYPADADPLDFSFSDVYNPVNFIQARQGEARVWVIFSQIADPNQQFQAQYESYAVGANLTNRMPLYVEPHRKLSLNDVRQILTSHFEGTVLDPTKDVGSGLFEVPYRPRPLEWMYNGTKYHNERTLATFKSGWSFIAQTRPWMPEPLGTILWWAADDSSTAPYVPIYSSSTRIAPAYAGKGTQDGVQSPLMQFDLDRAYWVQNLVSNFCYYRWKDAYPMVRKRIDAIQADFERQVARVDSKAMSIYQSSKAADAVEYVTSFSVSAGTKLHQKWTNMFGELFVRFRDFYTISPNPNNPVCGCDPVEPGLSDAMHQRIVTETGDHYKSIEPSTLASATTGSVTSPQDDMTTTTKTTSEHKKHHHRSFIAALEKRAILGTLSGHY